ncbi:MAG TPA: hypothetical protein VFM85_02825 [Actinomycetota bacterium]|nr:hypothetical protein [Actinomycetota bacterium]
MCEHSRQEVARRAGDAFWPVTCTERPVTFTEIGLVELKGVSGTPRLHTARRAA